MESHIHFNLGVDEQPPVLGARPVVAGIGWQEQSSVARPLPHIGYEPQDYSEVPEEEWGR